MRAGVVLETIDIPDDGLEPRVWINVRGFPRSPGQLCAIYVKRTAESRSVSPGDGIRWEGTYAYWTPKGAPFTDRPLTRLGFAGVARPTLHKELAP